MKSLTEKVFKVAVLGATGYTGTELVRILINHPSVQLNYLSSESYSGKGLSEVHPQFSGLSGLKLSSLATEAIPDDTDLVFCALPHGSSVEKVPKLLESGFKVIDLSADFRLKDSALYPLWYEREHACKEFLERAVYGLPEIKGAEIAKGELIANPGCYPTAILLGLAPLALEGLLMKNNIIIDAKSGVTGAGRSPKQPFHYPECNDSFKAYRVASHQHTPEIEQELAALLCKGGMESAGNTFINNEESVTKSFAGEVAIPADEAVKVTFTPHLIPMSRGILATIYVDLKDEKNGEDIFELYKTFYGAAPFVQILREPLLPETRWVKGSNYCHIAVRKERRTGKVIILSAIDNLVKGASGQAVQNMNIIFGLQEETGLKQIGLTP